MIGIESPGQTTQDILVKTGAGGGVVDDESWVAYSAHMASLGLAYV